MQFSRKSKAERRADRLATQLQSLHRLVPHARQSPGSPDCWDVALPLPHGDAVTVRVYLSDGFPKDPPSIHVVEVSPLGALTHPWLDHSQHVVGCEALRTWTKKKSKLGVVVQSVLDEFSLSPPQLPVRVRPAPIERCGSSYEDLVRSSKLESLRRVPHLQQCREDGRRWEVGVRSAHGAEVTLQLLLPDRFPMEAPVAHIVQRGVSHAWLDRAQRVVGCPALNAWNCVTSDPGSVVETILAAFAAYPPVWAAPPRWDANPGPGLSRESHIEALQTLPGVHQCVADGRAWDVRVATMGPSSWVTLRTFLPEGFPVEAPRMHVVERGVTHPLLNVDQVVTGSAALRAWTCLHSNLGRVVRSVVQELVAVPPAFVANNSIVSRRSSDSALEVDRQPPARARFLSYSTAPVGDVEAAAAPPRPVPPAPYASASTATPVDGRHSTLHGPVLARPAYAGAGWVCPVCTLHNPGSNAGGHCGPLTCAACASPCPAPSQNPTAAAGMGGAGGPAVEPLAGDPTWDCPECTLRNSQEALACAACAAPRPRDSPHHLSVIPAKDLELDLAGGLLLGSGSFGTVQAGRWCGCQVAVKGSGTDCRDRDSLLREQRIYEQLLLKPHMNIVKVLGVCVDASDNQLRLVMERCVQSVHDLLQTSAPKGGLPLWQLFSIMQQVCAGLHHLHRMGILHRDLRAANVLVVSWEPFRVAIADFGLSHAVSLPCAGRATSPEVGGAGFRASSPSISSPSVAALRARAILWGDAALGPLQWAAPETCVPDSSGGTPATPAGDVYMAGGLLFELLTGLPPFHWIAGHPTLLEARRASSHPVDVPGVPGCTKPGLLGLSVLQAAALDGVPVPWRVRQGGGRASSWATPGCEARFCEAVAALEACWATDAAARPTARALEATFRSLVERQEAAAPDMSATTIFSAMEALHLSPAIQGTVALALRGARSVRLTKLADLLHNAELPTGTVERLLEAVVRL